MKKEKLVSIIIPIYNGEKFIEKCMDSVLNQTYKNIEIILSDDGSTDNSLKIIKQYSKKYKNIKYDSHENVGLSITRNIAFELATGDYVTYLDVDDYFDYDFISKMLENNKNYDIIIGGYRSVYPNGNINFEYSLNDSEWNRYRRATVWAKIYKYSFLKNNNIIYPNVRLYGEDVVYTMRCLSKTNNVLIKKYIGYNNLINENSITHKNKNKIKNDVPKILKNIDNYISNNKKYLENNKKICRYYYVKLFVAYLVEQAVFLDFDELIEYYFECIDIIKNIFKNYNYKINFTWMKDEAIKVNSIINLFVLFYKINKPKILLKLLNLIFYKGDKR